MLWKVIPVQYCISLMLIMLADWLFQHFEIKPSTNLRRFITGMMCGIGYLHLWLNIAIFTVKVILKM